MRNKKLFILFFTLLIIFLNFIKTQPINLKAGDLILQKDNDNPYLDRKYGHSQLYIGYGFVIEAEPPMVHLDKVSGGTIYRVKTDTLTRSLAVGWAISKLGFPYDYNYTYKEVNGGSYYCSELCWSSYSIKGINIDASPFWESEFGFGVSVMEIAEDGDTYFVGTI